MILPGPGRRIRDRQREARAPLRKSKHIKARDVHFTANPTSSPRPTTAAYRAIAVRVQKAAGLCILPSRGHPWVSPDFPGWDPAKLPRRAQPNEPPIAPRHFQISPRRLTTIVQALLMAMLNLILMTPTMLTMIMKCMTP